MVDSPRRWPGADARTGYESRAGFQPGCSQFLLPTRNKGWTIHTVPGQAGEKDPSLVMRQLEGLTGRGAALTARLAPTNGLFPPWPKRPPNAKPPPQRREELRTRVQPRIGPGARAFKAAHATESWGPAVSCPAVTSPFCPGSSGSRETVLFHLYV